MHPEAFTKKAKDVQAVTCADIEKHNNNNMLIHQAYTRCVLDVAIADYIGKRFYKMVGDGWFPKVVYELVHVSEPNIPSLFIRKDLFIELESSGLLFVEDI